MSSKISDVARLARVSLPTVSRVLNKSKYVSEELKKRVLNAVAVLNYVPDDNARSLSSYKSNTVGIIVPVLNNSISRFINSCSTTLEESGYDLMIGKSGGEIKNELELIDLQLSMQVSGVILVSSHHSTKTAEILIKEKLPVVFAYNKAPVSGVHSRYFDNNKAASTLIASIPDIDSKNVYILSGLSDDTICNIRIEGFLKILENHNNYKIFQCDGTLEDGYKAAKNILNAEKPDILICLNDLIAIGALRAAYETGIKVPDEMEVTGFEGTSFFQISTPTLTTVIFDDYLLGRESADSIVSLIKGNEEKELEIFGYKILQAESCRLSI
ncbi:MAG: LacI family DNA-binding transcriptional regulator [Spirochaetales bacterium]|nr:LacI family DNA-binding transcriptional regulator [Spirochaetales bacterium]